MSRAGRAPCVLVQIREYEQVIIEDRMEKEKTRKKLEQDDLELKSIVKVGCAGSRRAWQAHCSCSTEGAHTLHGAETEKSTPGSRSREINGSKASFQP